MRAPPESWMPITGAPVDIARFMTLEIFSPTASLSEPPSSVKSNEYTYAGRPSTLPQPVTTASVGESTPGPRGFTSMSISSKLPGSRRTSMRSRAVSLPRACCASMRFCPPPASAAAFMALS